ncbi:SET domain protein [Mycena amicta]|nr:SET domain protein [Mycena amicta]
MAPTNWPPGVQYLTACSYHASTPQSTRKFLTQGTPDAADSSKPCKVLIMPINDPNHPAFGQLGLFAQKKIPPHRAIVDYIGQIHCDDRPNSDYDLSLYRSDTMSVGVDASKMGNEARFVNDFRGVADRPNASFVDYRTPNGELRVRIVSSNRAIKQGEEILVSYGRHWWSARSAV